MEIVIVDQICQLGGKTGTIISCGCGLDFGQRDTHDVLKAMECDSLLKQAQLLYRPSEAIVDTKPEFCPIRDC